MYNHELTEEYKALINGVVDGSIEAVRREGEIKGYTEARLGSTSEFFYPCRTPKEMHQSLNKPVSINLELDKDGIFAWRKVFAGDKIIESNHSNRLKAYSKPRNYKYRARVALEALRARLDKGVL